MCLLLVITKINMQQKTKNFIVSWYITNTCIQVCQFDRLEKNHFVLGPNLSLLLYFQTHGTQIPSMNCIQTCKSESESVDR